MGSKFFINPNPTAFPSPKVTNSEKNSLIISEQSRHSANTMSNEILFKSAFTTLKMMSVRNDSPHFRIAHPQKRAGHPSNCAQYRQGCV